MIKINISFSKKVPVPGQQFSSLSFHASMERELSDGLSGQQIQQEYSRGYALLEQTVEEEINRHIGAGKSTPYAPKPQTGNSYTQASITDKQLQLINRRGAEMGLTQEQINAHVMNRAGKESVELLTKKQASDFIDYLTKIQRAA